MPSAHWSMPSTDTRSNPPDPGPLRALRLQLTAAVTLTLAVTWLVGCFGLLLPFALIKLALPLEPVRQWTAGRMDRVVGLFSGGLGRLLRWMHVGDYRLEVDGELRQDRTYLLICNHQSWVDIVYLLILHHRRVPFPRFFLKRELLWFPIIGFACWAMDFPFMRRYSSRQRAANPALAQRDLDTARKACERYRNTPVTIINYVEGTRLSRARHQAQQSPWQHLLRPRAGGIHYVMSAMGDQLAGVIDTTVVYPSPEGPGFWRFLTGVEQPVLIRMRLRPVPEGLALDDPQSRQRAEAWVNRLWDEKDAEIAEMRQQLPS